MRLSHARNKNGEEYYFRFKAKKGQITTFLTGQLIECCSKMKTF